MANGRSAPEAEEGDMLARAAWLHFVGGMTHAEVGAQLRVPGFKIQRLIARATRSGVVQVFINSPVADCVRLERTLCRIYRLVTCLVAPRLGDVPASKALAAAGAQSLFRILQTGSHRTIGLGHGRTLSANVAYLPHCHAPDTSFVALHGGLTTSFSADPYDVIHSITGRTGAHGYFLSVPFFANSAADRAVLLAQIGVMQVQALARTASLFLVGVGTATRDGFLVQNGSIGEEDLARLTRLGAKGEILGYFHDRDRRRIETGISDRTVTLSYDELAGCNIVAAGGGADKIDALQAILRSGLLKGLITDEATAATLVARADGAAIAVCRSCVPVKAANRVARPASLQPPRARRAGAR